MKGIEPDDFVENAFLLVVGTISEGNLHPIVKRLLHFLNPEFRSGYTIGVCQ